MTKYSKNKLYVIIFLYEKYNKGESIKVYY